MRHHERGFALPIVLLLVILAAAGSALIVTRVRTTHQETAVHAASVQALWAAEGAIESAAHALRRGATPPRALRIGGHDVDLDVKPTDAGWDVRARTVPNVAEIHVTLDGSGRQTTWKRIR